MATERKALPVIHKTRCTGCGWCVAVCPPHVLSLEVENWKKFLYVLPMNGGMILHQLIKI
jgi:ferredoxin